MSLTTEWIISSYGPRTIGGRTGNYPAVLDHVPFRLGQWIGCCPAPGHGKCLMAITYDDALVDPAVVAADLAKLVAAPDADVFDMRQPPRTPKAAWLRRQGFLDSAAANYVDAGRITGGKLVHHLREWWRTYLVYREVGLIRRPLSTRMSDVGDAERARIASRMEQRGWPTSRAPGRTGTLRTFYRRLLEEPRADYGIDSGVAHMGRPDVNLGPAAESLGVG